MTRELIINGQHVDLPASTDITLEFANNVVDDVGKITLAHSYTIKLPRTIRNARILDDPGTPAHESTATRRFLSAHYYRNGMDLMGPLWACVLKTTQTSYEIMLSQNVMEELQTLSQSAATLNDLPDLPVVAPWVNPNGYMDQDYTFEESGAILAKYNMGIPDSSEHAEFLSGAGRHPAMRLCNLAERVFGYHGVRYEFTASARQELERVALLAAPDAIPSLKQEIQMGQSVQRATINSTRGSKWSSLTIGSRTTGEVSAAFDDEGGFSTQDPAVNNEHPMVQDFFKGGLRILINACVKTELDLSQTYFVISTEKTYTTLNPANILHRFYFEKTEGGWAIYAEVDIDYSGAPMYLGVFGVPAGNWTALSIDAYKTDLPPLAIMHRFKYIPTVYSNEFPLAGNLPKIKQWDLIKACAALFGLVLVPQGNRVRIMTYQEMLEPGQALDWSDKVTGDTEVAYSLSNWKAENIIAYKEQEGVRTAQYIIKVEDETNTESATRYQLPFVTTTGDEAIHYKALSATSAERLKIDPHIFDVVEGTSGRSLVFTENLTAEGIAQRYTALQAAVRKPVQITTNIRLHELDIAELDLTRPIYLRQFGRYYTILKIQTSATDLCKVELLQLPQ